MKFVRQGPDIPERLLLAHEDGRVVLFCGAGISYPARLPDFAGLVAKIYQYLSVTPNPVQQAAIKAGRFDTAIGLLEADVVGGRESVRRALATILTPDLTTPNATVTHEALLTLAKNREGRTRLITTNFDRLFEQVIEVKLLSTPSYQAPLLPVPKNRWDGMVYLHGLLPATPTPSDLERLVISSGDFGLAYLAERWAARFVSELFRNYTVCFVGYSINDPVLRYMMDALAADRLLGESPPEMFAFGSFPKGRETERANEWKAKNVTPILYREHQHHTYLHKTLRAWAETYRDGVRGKERIVVESVVDSGHSCSRWNEVMHHLACWLTRHLDDRHLLIWLIKRGGQLHDQLVWLIECRLAELAKLNSDGNTAELARIRANSPNAIPRPTMRTLWRLLLTGRVKSGACDLNLYHWHDQFKTDGLSASVRIALREALTPRVSLREPFRWPGEDDGNPEPERVKDLVEWEIVLTADHVHSDLRDLSEDKRWTIILPELLDDFSTLLRDAFDLMRELGGADEKSDNSYVHQPSIGKHPQNKDFHDWTALIELARDAWLAKAAQSPEQARIAAEAWAYTPYPLFRRLAFFAATEGHVIPHRLALNWLLADDHWWLWSLETKRETIRLLIALAPQLTRTMLAELEQVILSGPPRAMYRDDIESDDWNQIVDREIWLRLAKIAETTTALGAAAQKRLYALSSLYPDLKLSADQSDEFSFWMGVGDEWREFTPTPRCRRELIERLRQQPTTNHWQEDDWRKRCSDNFATTACTLYALTKEGIWPVERWRSALQAWSEEKLLVRSWRYMAPVLMGIPDEVLQNLAHSVTWWLQSIAKTFQRHEAYFWALAKRILQLDFEDDGDTDDPVFRAINHPVGHVTEALLRWWYRQTPEDGQGLPENIKHIFSKLCDTQIGKFRHGRLLLATHAIALFRVDRNWATLYLLPLFDWHCSETEARAAWKGFLWSPRLYHPLMELLKPAFLDTANHYTELGKHNGQYVSLLTYAALDPGDTFTTAQLATVIRTLPSDGQHEAIKALMRTLEGAGNQREDYWKNRIQPFWERIWPKSNKLVSNSNAESLARLCIAAGQEFPSAISVIGKWLRPVKYPHYVICRLRESGFSAQFPKSALSLLDAVLSDESSGPFQELRECLDAIVQAMPSLCQDHRLIRLDEFSRQHGS